MRLARFQPSRNRSNGEVLQRRYSRRTNCSKEVRLLELLNNVLRAGCLKQMRSGPGTDKTHTKVAASTKVPRTVPNIDDILEGPVCAHRCKPDDLRATRRI